MSKPIERVEIITGRERRRRYSAEEKVRLVEETARPGMTVSAVARLHGVSPSLLFGWRRRMAEGGLEAVRADDDVVAASRVRELEAKVRELERLLGRKTMEAEILREALEHARPKKLGWQSWLAGLLLQPGEIGCWIAAEPGAQGSGVAPLIEPGAEVPPAVSADTPQVARGWWMEPCRGGGDQAHLTAQHDRGRGGATPARPAFMIAL
jgi:transposase